MAALMVKFIRLLYTEELTNYDSETWHSRVWSNRGGSLEIIVRKEVKIILGINQNFNYEN